MMGTLKGSPSPPALWLRRAKPACANTIGPLLGACLVLAGGAARAEVAAEIEGEVVGPDGGPLPGVDLVVTDGGGGARQAAIADGRGRFVFLLPAPGVWRVALHGVGPEGAQTGAIVVDVPARARVRLRLRVTADAPAGIEASAGEAADALPAPGGDRLPARGVSVGQAMTAVPGAAAPAPPGDGPVLAGTDPAEAELRLGGLSLRDPVDGRVPWELPLPLFAGARPHLGTGDAVDGESGRGGVDLFAPRAERARGVRLLAVGDVVAPAGEILGAERPHGWLPAGLLLAGVEGRSAGGRLRGGLTVAPNAAGWEADPASPRFARSRRTRLLPVLARADAELGGFALQLTGLALATRLQLGRPPGALAAEERRSESRDLALVGLEAWRPLVRGLDLGLRAGVLGGRTRWAPLAGDPLRASGERATLAAELRLLGEAAGRHRLRFGAGFEGERARRRGPDAVRPGEPVVDRSSAGGRTLHVAADERYRPASWLELEAGMRVASLRAHGRAELPGAAPLDRDLRPGLQLAPRAGLSLFPPLPGSRLDLRAGRFGGPQPLWPLLAGATGQTGAVSLPSEDVALARAQLAGGAWRVSAIALERRTAQVLEDRLSPATGRLELIRPRVQRRYRALIGSAEGHAPWLTGGVAFSWSRLRGNHEGFTDPYTGRLRPASTLTWDALSPGPSASGPLPYDRPLSLRLYAQHGRAVRCPAAGCRVTGAAAFRLDGGTPLSPRGWSAEGGEGATVARGMGGRTAAVARLDAAVELSFLAGGRRTRVAVQGANLTNHRPVVAREALTTDGPGAAAARPTHDNPVAWAEPLSLKLVVGLDL
jgi:hypothetical protein